MKRQVCVVPALCDPYKSIMMGWFIFMIFKRKIQTNKMLIDAYIQIIPTK